MRKLLLLFLSISLSQLVWSQTCEILATTKVVCIGNTVTLSVVVSGGTPVSYNWNLGDASTSTQPVVVHSYLATGTYTPTVVINLLGGGTCNATGLAIQVVALPLVNYTILSPDTICYKFNSLCIKDLSTAGPSGAPINQRIWQLNNGYIQIDALPFAQTICYENTTDFFGRSYDMLLEITDTNGCVSRLTKNDSVYLLPRNQEIGFVLTNVLGCDTTRATFINSSLFPQSQAKSWTWFFDDGTFDNSSTRWTNFTHKYFIPGTYSPALVVTDRNNCVDTFKLNNGVTHLAADSFLQVISKSSPPSRCYSNQVWDFVNAGPGSKNWYIFKDNVQIDSLFGFAEWENFTFKTCGQYRVRVKGNYANCNWTKDTLIDIFGPKAIIENDTAKVLNRNQCQIHDTIYFKSPVPYLSCHNLNPKMYRLWDFGDAFAPPCTTDTKNNINVGVNCRYSKDSLNVKHRYYDGKEDCYRATLFMMDSITGCSHSDTVAISLSPPDAGWDSTITPARPGLYYKGQKCLNTILEFYLDSVLPYCGFEKAWINWDTACNPKSWILQDTTITKLTKVSHIYTDHCNPNGDVVVGLVLRNGKDAFGNYCYDTAYYPFFHFIKKNPQFNFIKFSACPPYNLQLKLTDTVQPNLEYVYWLIERVENGSSFKIKDTTQRMNGDSLILPISVNLPNNGSYRIFIAMKDIDGCLQGFSQSLSLGFKMEIGVDKQVQCLGVPFTLYDNVRYYLPFDFDVVNPRNYWAEADRVAAGKELLWWDIGDGNGFSIQGSNPLINYSKPGIYTIKLVAKDSLNCYDTLVYTNFIEVVHPDARIWTADSVFLCAPQIVAFRDSSVFLDSTGAITTSVPDQINAWYWDFGDNKQPRILPNPAHNFTSNGIFNVMFVITTLQGCKDTAYKQISIKGPEPSFEMSDTLGCMPFEITFDNTTAKKLLSWTWYFGDSNNTILSTQSDTSFTFSYTKPGIYKVRLLGIDTLRNPSTGNLITCTAIFPDTTTDLPSRNVYVQFTPELNIFGPDSICPNEETIFYVNGDPIYTAYTWYFSATDSTNKQFPDSTITYIYTDPGVYGIRVLPYTTMFTECADTPFKEIVVLGVQAGFDIDETKAPSYQFSNTAQGAVRYEWYDKKGVMVNPFSTALNPTYNYKGDSFSFVICQVVYNPEDCWDSICREVFYYSDVKIPNVFTPGNDDNTNDAFDIEIAGEKKYELVIYNRWGGLVFKGDKDGLGNDGVNWNGKTNNEGEECPSGVYYYVFKYQFMTDEKDREVNGTVTIIR